MAKRKKMRRRRRRAKRFDPGVLGRMLGDGQRPATLARIIEVDEGSTQHFELELEGTQVVDITQRVETIPDGEDLTCSLAGLAGRGVLTIPELDDIVVVIVPDGDESDTPVIVAVVGSNNIPNPSGQGPAANRTLIVNSEVFIHDGSGGAAPLPTLLEHNNHTHPSGMGPTGTPSIAATGTTVLKTK